MGNTALNASVRESDARLFKIEGEPTEAGFRLYRQWPYLQGKSNDTALDIKDLTESLKSVTSVNNPMANDTRYTGTFVVSDFFATDENGDGSGDRACAIVQKLSLVKTVTDVASMGTPFKDADKETLNFLGFKEGLQEHIYHRYTNLNPANRATTMGLSPTESGYTIVFRKFITEKDQTGTFYVVFEKDTWGNLPWTNNKKVQVNNYDTNLNPAGYGMSEVHQLTGVSRAQYDSAITSAKNGDTGKITRMVRVVEKGKGEYQVDQVQARIFTATDTASADVVHHKNPFTGNGKALSRIWRRRTDSAKNTLVASGGNALAGVTYQGIAYKHDEVFMDEEDDGAWNVRQNLSQTDGASSYTLGAYFRDSYIVKKVLRRTRDDMKKTLEYWKFVAARGSFSSAQDFIDDIGDLYAGSPTTRAFVKGSDKVVRKGQYYYVATCLVERTNEATVWA